MAIADMPNMTELSEERQAAVHKALDSGLTWNGQYRASGAPILTDGNGQEWSGRFNKDGSVIMQKSRSEFKEREVSEENQFARRASGILRDLCEVPETNMRVRADTWGEGRTVFIRHNGVKASITTMEDLRAVVKALLND